MSYLIALVRKYWKKARKNLKVNIDSEFHLNDVAKAHERSESGHTQGKIINVLK